METELKIITPGEALKKSMDELGISNNALGRYLGTGAMRISNIVNGKTKITVDTARRLASYFKTDAQSWINLQTNYDIRTAQRKDNCSIEKEIRSRMK